MAKRYDNILETIGNTPVVRINHLGPAQVNLYVKLESFNPMGSVKDRLARAVIEAAEHSGELQPGQTVVEATSGNTGIGLAMVCAQKGYPLVIVMAENFSVERRRLLRFLGANVVLTPAAEKGTGMVAKAAELAQKHGWWLARQFENPVNADIHEHTTAVEILEAFSDTSLDYWVTGFGTGGTLTGVSRLLRQRSPKTRIVVCEPDNSSMLASGIPQPQSNAASTPSHPLFRPHLMQGWSPDFIPRLMLEVTEEHRVDEFCAINGIDALDCARNLARREGIFVGISSGATFAGALQIARKAAPGSNILCMLPDTGERYLSTVLFEDVQTDMNEAELEISRSTPGYRFDQPSASPPTPASTSAPVSTPTSTPPATSAPAIDAQATDAVESEISNPDQPVVMFALEWCEFCWSVRKVLNRYGIPFTSVDLDSVAYQQDNRGGSIRAALTEKTGMKTLPQIFVGGELIGGCTELFDQIRNGSLLTRLDKLGVAYDRQVKIDPYHLLPTWLHPR